MKENDRKRDAQGVSGGGSTFTQRVLKKSNWPTQNFQFKGMKWDFMFGLKRWKNFKAAFRFPSV